MILRRVMEHVRTQNWLAVGIDFVIVVLGVFVGIQLGNWNEEAAARRLAGEYEERLATVLSLDLAQHKALIAYLEVVLEAVVHADALTREADPDPLDVVATFYRASEVNLAPPTRSVWDEIVASGRTDLLPQSVLDAGLPGYYLETATINYDQMFASGYRQLVRQLIPLPVQVAIREGCSDVRDELSLITGFVETCTIDVPPELLEETARELLADEQLTRELTLQYSLIISAVTNLSGDAVVLERSLEALEAEGAQSRLPPGLLGETP